MSRAAMVGVLAVSRFSESSQRIGASDGRFRSMAAIPHGGSDAIDPLQPSAVERLCYALTSAWQHESTIWRKFNNEGVS